jgi:hypothetical protein
MPTDRVRLAALAAPLLLLGGCETDDMMGVSDVKSTFGEPNRQTLAAQVIDPDPQYEYSEGETSGQKAAAAVERYRTDRVKQPQSIRSTSGSGSGS